MSACLLDEDCTWLCVDDGSAVPVVSPNRNRRGFAFTRGIGGADSRRQHRCDPASHFGLSQCPGDQVEAG